MRTKKEYQEALDGLILDDNFDNDWKINLLQELIDNYKENKDE